MVSLVESLGSHLELIFLKKYLLKSILDNSLHPNLIVLGFDVNDSKFVEKYIQPLIQHTELKFIEIYSDYSNFGKAVTSKLL